MSYTLRAFGAKGGKTITARDLTFLGDDSGNVPEAYRDMPCGATRRSDDRVLGHGLDGIRRQSR